MKDITPKSFTESLKDLLQFLEDGLRRAVRAIAALSWPALLGAALALALVLTILPLAIFVFAMFLLIKLIVAGFGKPRQLPPPQAPEGQ